MIDWLRLMETLNKKDWLTKIDWLWKYEIMRKYHDVMSYLTYEIIVLLVCLSIKKVIYFWIYM